MATLSSTAAITAGAVVGGSYVLLSPPHSRASSSAGTVTTACDGTSKTFSFARRFVARLHANAATIAPTTPTAPTTPSSSTGDDAAADEDVASWSLASSPVATTSISGPLVVIGAALLGAPVITRFVGAIVSVVIGTAVGTDIGAGVGGSAQTLLTQVNDEQSSFSVQVRPTLQRGQSSPPQSTSVSLISIMPFVHVSIVGRGVGTRVGVGDGTPVGVGVGTAVGTSVGPPVGTAVGTAVGAAVGTPVGPLVGTAVGTRVGAGLGTVEGAGLGTAVGSGLGAGVGENVSTDTDRTDADDIERRRLAASSSAEADPSRRWPSAMAKSTIAAVRVPSATDALSTSVTYCNVKCARGA